MPIIISHQPPMELLSRAGWYVGAGEERARQEEMQQRERMQMRGIESNLLSQQLAYQQQLQRDAMGAQYDAARGQAAFEQQLELQRRQDDMRKRLAEIDRDQQLEFAERQMKSRRELENTRYTNEVEADQIRYLHGQADDVLKTVRSLQAQGFDFESDEERRRYEGVLRQLDAVQKNATLRPSQKAQAAFHLTSDLPLPRTRRESFDDYVRSSTTKVEDPNNPGQYLLLGRDRSGEPRVLSQPSTDRMAADQEQRLAEQKLKAQEAQSDHKLYQDAFKMLTRQERPKDSITPVTVHPTHDEVQKLVQRMKGAGVPPIKMQWDADGNLLTSPQEAAEALRRLSTPGENAPVIWDEGGSTYEPSRDEAIEALRQIVAQERQRQQRENVVRFRYTEDGQLVPVP